MKKAATFYYGSVARRGGYVYFYSPDLSRRLGEGVAGKNEIWVQPPGTPTVGRAYLSAYHATGDEFYLKAAIDAGRALLHGQLESGAWTNSIDFDPKGPRADRYRNGKGRAKGRNFSTLDDDISQSATQFLMELDRATGFREADIHRGVEIALSALLKAQFPNGAFPQGWDETPAKAGKAKGLKGNFPDYDWRTEGRIKEYWDQYNLNDGIAPTVAATLMAAHRIYDRKDCLESLTRFGDFLILAQMPAPQPAWAQQYNGDMQPIWARKFEPPAIAVRESEGVVEALMMIAAYCRNKEYLEPIPRALDYLERSQLPDGRSSRYYELESNKPLYMERVGQGYQLTYDDSKLPSHYGWKNQSRVSELRKTYSFVMKTGRLPEEEFSEKEWIERVGEVRSSLDDHGRWISRYSGESLVGQPRFRDGEEYLNSAVFSRNLKTLSEALSRERNRDE